MSLTITDEMLRQAGLSGREALLELACHLYEVGRLSLWSAASFAGLERVEFEAELRRRNLAVHRPTLEDLSGDLTTLDSMGT